MTELSTPSKNLTNINWKIRMLRKIFWDLKPNQSQPNKTGINSVEFSMLLKKSKLYFIMCVFIGVVIISL